MKTAFQNRIAAELAGVGLPFVAFGTALNLTVGQISGALKLPLYLDSIGTVLVAVLCGPWSAVVAGTTSNLLAAAFGMPQAAFFIPVVMAIGAFTGFLARRGWFRRWYLALAGGLLQGFLAAVISAPIAAYVFGGVMLSGTDVLVLYFRSVGNTLLQSVLMQGMISDPLDKTVTYLLVFFLLRGLPLRLLRRFPGGRNILVLPEEPDAPTSR
jgi:energy-coupling factor transport system substrate-specific component